MVSMSKDVRLQIHLLLLLLLLLITLSITLVYVFVSFNNVLSADLTALRGVSLVYLMA